MSHSIMIALIGVLFLGVLAQWVAWRIRVPSIIPLLLFGFIAGPIGGILDPHLLMGDLLFPWVSLMVSIIVFEGGLSLRLSDLKEIGPSVWRLVVGATLISFGIITVANYYILGLSYELAILFGAMMVITGPTVIVPMLRHVKLSRSFGSLLRWEGILIAPVGTILIVLVYQALFSGQTGVLAILLTFLMTVGLGAVLGGVGAFFIMTIIRKNWAPDFLQEVISLVSVVGVYSVGAVFQTGSGLVAMVVMGLVLANQRLVMVRHIITFKENLRILALSTLFIVLSSSLELDLLLSKIDIQSLWYLLVLIFVARPVSVFISTLGSRLNYRERLFLSWMAPRGIVTASIASLFALRLVDLGVSGAEKLVPLAFMVIIVSVCLYGFSAVRVQKILGLDRSGGDSLMFIGANGFSRMLATALKGLGVYVMLIDTNKDSVIEARLTGLSAYHLSAFSDKALEEVELGGVGNLLALTSSDEANILAMGQYSDLLGKGKVYRLSAEMKESRRSALAQQFEIGTVLFGKGVSSSYLNMRIHSGARIEIIPLSKAFDYKAFQVKYGDRGIALVAVDPSGGVRIGGAEGFVGKVGDTLLALV